jgi:hypothetical protein
MQKQDTRIEKFPSETVRSPRIFLEEFKMRIRNPIAKLFPLLFVLLVSAQMIRAQDVASMTGVVTDATGAVLPGTLVTLSNPSTGVSYTQTTDNLGSYRFLNVPPNPGYKATFAHAGFATAVVSDITLSVATTRTQNARLAVGATSLTVQVSASSAIVTLDTTDAAIGNSIDIEQLNELPVYDRATGIATLFVQQPGVDSYQGAVTGARIDQSSVTVDGLDVNDVASGQTFAIVATAPVDSVQQFTGTVAGLVSSVGTGSGAGFQLVTKSGTNKFHGDLNEYHRDTSTVANTWFNNLDGIPRTPLIRNQFGGNIGGPIVKNKLFFFFDIVDSKIVQSATAEPIVPLAALRAGTLNYINNGSGCGDSTRITSFTSLPACISTLSASDLTTLDPGGIGFDSSEISFITGRYPEANDLSRGDGVNTAGYRFTYPTPDNRITYVGRVDYNLTPTQKIFGRFTITRRNAIESAPEFKTDPVTHPFIDRSYGYVVSHVWNIGSTKVNQFYYGDNISKFSFPDLYNPTGANQYSFSGLSGPYTAFDGQQRRVPIPVVRDDFNWQRGAHSLTMGGSFKFIKTNSNLINNFNFVGAGLQGQALGGGLCGPTPGDCDSLHPSESLRPSDIYQGGSHVALNDYDNLFATGLGVIGTISTNFNYNNAGAALPAGSGGPRAYRFFETEMYAGDTWKVTRKLTLSYGLRYQLYSVPYESHGEESVPITSPSNGIDLDTFIKDRLAQSAAGDSSNTGLPIYSYVLGGKANHGPDMYGMSYKDVAPRFAFAYTPFNSQKTVINGGAGIIYDRTVINAIDFLQDQISYLFSNTNTNQFGSAGGAYASLAADTRLGANLAYSSALNPAPSPIASPYIPYVDGSGTPYGLPLGETSFVINPNLKDPYSIALNFGIQQEIPGHMVLKVNYVGRLGRRLLADADANQVIDVPDYTGGSTQTMAEAYAGLTTDLRAGKNYHTVTAEPWFEDVIGTNGTKIVAYYTGQYAYRGDISDSLAELAYFSYFYGTGWIPTNIGIPSQFGTNAYLTNKGSSNYHALLLTLDKNISQGLRFEFNYTWSHSIDNTSLSANNNSLFSNTGFICDILQPRACRASSDFDVRQEISSNFAYDLPFGRGKMFGANVSRGLDEVIGGWSFSGLPSYRTGLPVTPYSDAYLASFDNQDPAIFTGTKADLKTKVNVDYTSNTVYGFAGGATGASTVLAKFRGPIGLEYGQRNLVRGPGAFYFDAGLGKRFPILENKLNLLFRADAFNLFNHPNFGTPSLNIVTNASNFGQITGTITNPSSLAVAADNARVAQFSLRLEF